MDNQDEVASMLARVPAEEMHALMYRYGIPQPGSWSQIIREVGAAELLKLHGWTLDKYIDACSLRVDTGTFESLMCKEFVLGYNNG